MTARSGVALRGGDDIAVVCGSRTELIRLAPVVAAFAEEPRVIVADPRDHPDRPTSVARLVETVAGEFSRRRPRVVVVHGGTPAGIAAAHVAGDDGISVVYADAGMPASEGSALASTRSSVYAATTIRAAVNLRRWGVDPALVSVTGSTVVETVRSALAPVADGREREFDHLPIHHGFLLAAIHHPENIGDAASLERALGALRHTEAVCVLVVRPAARAALERFGRTSLLDGLVVIPDVPHRSFVRLARRAELLVSDSVAMQEECTVLGSRLLVLRRELDRPEAAEAGFARLIPPSADLAAEIASELRDDEARDRLRIRPTPFGDGRSGIRIASLAQRLAGGQTAADAVAALDADNERARQYPSEPALMPSGSARA